MLAHVEQWLQSLLVEVARWMLVLLRPMSVAQAAPESLREHFDWVWMNRRLMPYLSAKIHVGAHALHYATSAFEGIKAYRVNGVLTVWKLRAHVERLFQSFAALGFTIPYSAEELMEAILAVVSLNDDGQVQTLYIRPVVFMDVDPETKKGLGVDPKRSGVSVAIMTQPWGAYLSEGIFNGGATVFWSDHVRLLPAQAQTLKQAGVYGLTSVPAKLAARQCGASESFCVNFEGDALDGTGQTLCAIVRDVETGGEVVITPDPVAANILAGTTRTFLFDEAHARHLPCRWKHVPSITKTMVRSGQVVGMFFLGTAVEVTPITRVWIDVNGQREEITIGDGHPHPIALAFTKFYGDVVHGMYPEYEDHLTQVPPRNEVLAGAIISGRIAA